MASSHFAVPAAPAARQPSRQHAILPAPAAHVAPAVRQLSAPVTSAVHVAPAARQHNNHVYGNSSTLWFTMVRRSRRDYRPTEPPTNADSYLNLRVSRLKHRNRHFHDTHLIVGTPSGVHTSLCRLQWRNATLRFALAKATEDDTPSSSSLVDDILSLNKLMERSSTNEDAARWIRDTQRETATNGSRADRSFGRQGTTTPTREPV